MKHIKKRYQFEGKITPEIESRLEKTPISSFSIDANIIPKGKQLDAYLITDDSRMIRTFRYSYQGKNYYIPEPNPVLIYFNSAYWNLKEIKDRKPELFKALSEGKLNASVSHNLYFFYGSCVSFVTNLFCAIEAFINSIIPENYVYNDVQNRKTESFNKKQIQEYIDFKSKISVILKQISGKDYSKSPNYQRILNLKELRDFIVHTKMTNEHMTPYEHIFKKCLDFKYSEALDATKAFINFYQNNFIEDCDCGKDF